MKTASVKIKLIESKVIFTILQRKNNNSPTKFVIAKLCGCMYVYDKGELGTQAISILLSLGLIFNFHVLSLTNHYL